MAVVLKMVHLRVCHRQQCKNTGKKMRGRGMMAENILNDLWIYLAEVLVKAMNHRIRSRILLILEKGGEADIKNFG